MTLTKRVGMMCICVLILFLVVAPEASGNSAEPPRLIVIVNFAPDDLMLSLRFQDGSADVRLHRVQTAWETQYTFTYGMVAARRPSLEGVILVATSGDSAFEYALPASMLRSYRNVISLDFIKQTVVYGQSIARSALLISLRVVLTLLIEGLVFFAYGYRSRRSWAVFIVINLITQGALNIALNNAFAGAYLILSLIFYEVIIVVVELFAFASTITEHDKRRTMAFVLVANFLSLILGGVLISYLPV